MTDVKARRLWVSIAFVLFFLLFRLAGPDGWDEAFYMAQLSSSICDGDLMLQNDVLMFDNPVPVKLRSATILHREGWHLNAFSAGPAFFYSLPMIPVYKAGVQRFGLGFQRAMSLWTAIFWCFALYALYGFLKDAGLKPAVIGPAILASFFSTPVIHYGMRFYLTAHWLSTILVIFILYFGARWLRTPTSATAWVTGFFSGLLCITRWESCLFLMIFIWPFFQMIRSKRFRKRQCVELLIACGAFLSVISIQMVVWKVQMDCWICMPQDRGFMLWNKPALWKMLVSGYHGLIAWSPGLLVGFTGLFLGKRTVDSVTRQLIPGLILFFMFQYYTSAAAWDWWGGASYGVRRMTLLFAPVCLGIAFLLQRVRLIWKTMLVTILVLWGLFTFSAYRWQVDDLTLLFTGKPDVYRPVDSPVRPEQVEHRWKHWRTGFRHIMKFGYSMENRPRPPHVRSGLVILSGIVLLAVALIHLLRRYRFFRRTIAIILMVYTIGVSIYMLSCFPRHKIWRNHWAAVATGQKAVLPDRKPPAGYMASVKVIKTARLFNRDLCRGAIKSQNLYDNSLPGLTIQDLVNYSKDCSD